MATNIKSYREYYRRLLFMEEERKKFFVEMSKVVSLGEGEKVKTLLDILKKEGRTKMLSQYRENDGESMLHVAAKFNQSSEIIQFLIKACPELMLTARKESDDYYGQTALHILIAKGNTEAVETLLAEIHKNHSQSVKAALLHQIATGAKFANTVMMGELPLSVAALKFNFEMIEALLQNGAEMDRKNTKGDTVFHTLIRFAAIYPKFTAHVLETLQFLHDKIMVNMVSPENHDVLSMECDHSDYSYRWFIPNADDLNPLQLAAQLSQAQIFCFILDLPKVYSFLNSHDGLFDKKLYDITEIDTVATEKWASYQRKRRNRMRRHVAPVIADGVARQKFSNPSNTSFSLKDALWREQTKSVLEMMFDIRGSAAYEFIQQPTVRHIIKTKWLYYRTFYYSWMIFHLLFMTALTVFAVLKAESYGTNATTVQDTQVSGAKSNDDRKTDFLDAYSYCYLVIGVVYFLHEVIHVLFRVKQFSLAQLLNVLHNGSYRVVLVIFSLSLVFDFILSKSVQDYENFTLIIALVTGWWFMVFFIRAHQKFSFFTVMIQKILFGDMLRFAVIIVLFMVAFTAGIHMAFQGTRAAADNDLDTFGGTMLLLFKLMLGLGDIDDLYKARRAWLAVTLFIIFVLLTYVLMFNALIAMMSQTCMMVSENRLVQWRVQQLSVIIFFEGIFPSCMAKLVGNEKHVKRFDPEIKQIIDEKRYYLDFSSVHTEYANAEDIYVMKYKLQTLPFGDIRTFSPNFNVTIPTQPFLSPRHQVYYTVPRQAQYGLDSPSGQPDNQSPLTPSVQVTPPHNIDTEAESPMLVKRRKSKRQKSPSNREIPSDNSPENPKPNKKKMKKKRIEPEGDINTSYDDQGQDRNFYLNQSHLTVPNFGMQNIAPPRRRYNSENGLMDTHIGQQSPLQIPVQPLHLPVEQVSRVQPHDGSALDIGVIADSYM